MSEELCVHNLKNLVQTSMAMASVQPCPYLTTAGIGSHS